MLTVADRGRGGKICQNLADVICERSLNSNKNTFFAKLNEDIEGGKVLNWQAFKKIKGHKETKIQHDSYDMDKFEKFFSNLYSDNHKTIDN